MLRNYLKIALRSLFKNKLSSLINVIGLTIGLTGCLLIALYIRNEVSYEDFQVNGNRIARVIMEYRFDGSGQSNKGNFTSVRVPKVFKNTFPEIENAVFMYNRARVVRYGESLINEKKFMFAGPEFFNIFSFPLLSGDPKRALVAPGSVVLTASTALKYFGRENPIGKTLQIGTDSFLYKVTGIAADCPRNSQIHFDFLTSFSSLGYGPEYEETYWDANFTTFLLLKTAGSINSLQAKLPAFMKKEMAGQGATINFTLEPLNRIHLYSAFDGFEPNTSISYIYILAAVALLILIIACSTFINLSTARSLERAREVGVRKVIGARKNQLFWQFTGESGMLCLISLLLSLSLAVICMPGFNQLTGKDLQVGSIFSPAFLGISLIITILVSLLAGSYPALVLADFHPVQVLKGSFKHMESGQTLRKSLIIFQFAISIFLIVSTLIIHRQLSFIQNKKLGYDREQILVLPIDEKTLARIPLLKQEFTSNSSVLSVSRCSRSPVEGGGYNMRSSSMPADEQFAVTANPVDEDYVRTTGMHLIAGENLSLRDEKDAALEDPKLRVYHFLLNESASRQLGWTPTEAVGKKMFLGDGRAGFVKGVIEDYHFESLHQPIRPIVLFTEDRGSELLIKLNGQKLPNAIAFLESKWKKLVPERPFEYRFLDDDYNKLYSSEHKLGMMMNIFSGLAIILACLGLFGLSSYSVQQRIKEIGVRKILGASINNIVVLISGSFVRLTFFALLIALPLAWWSMSEWLSDFAYRTKNDLGAYAIAGLAVILLSLLTVSYQAMRAARSNPVSNLRTE
jgi:putative ABC transport system permease protein